ncbi:MAG: polysaccharide deacetylase family protein [Candidatus Eremiobacteraeota bacterium]|nr:polysaccharide deacetylase family protein [Candidatus Eremiobacteraeota bacterium]
MVRRNWRLVALILGLCTLAFAAALWYILENPVSQTFGRTVTMVPLHQKVVALTFDDGPNPPYTNEIVDYLRAHHAVATFFVVGSAVARFPDVVRAEVRNGDALGNHTWDHAHLVLESSAHIARELQRTDAIIQSVAGVQTRLFRPPFGARDYRIIRVAHRLGYTVVMWSVPLPHDWSQPPPQVIRDRVLRYVKDGSIIVLHDGNRGRGGNRKNTVEATKLIVDELQRRGYRLVTVPELLQMGYAEATKKQSVPGPQME